MMKILDARVQWMKKWANNPYMEVFVDKIPPYDDLIYEYKKGLYYAELNGCVHFLYKNGWQKEDGFGGHVYKIKVKNMEKLNVPYDCLQDDRVLLKGPWSSRAGCANKLGFGPCVNVSITDDPQVWERGYTFFAGSITLDKMVEAAQIAGVYLVKCYDKNDKKGWDLSSDGEQSFIVHLGVDGADNECSFDTEIPLGVEYTIVPSLDKNRVIKEQD